jgi:hypothetical protein
MNRVTARVLCVIMVIVQGVSTVRSRRHLDVGH